MTQKKWCDVEKLSLTQSSLEESINQRDTVDTDIISSSLLTRNLMFFILLKTIGSFDSGAFSGALGVENGIAEQWNLSSIHQGTLTSSVFLGNIIGCILSGNLFSRYSAKKVLLWSFILHTIFTFFFASSTNYGMLLLFRFLIGITLSFIIVYTPLWVDTFAPHDRQSMWMALHNAGVPLGVMFGYIFGALLPSYTSINWEWAFYIKCVFTVPVVTYLIRVDSRSIDQCISTTMPECCLILPSTKLQYLDKGVIMQKIECFYVNIICFWRTCFFLVNNVEFMSSVLSMCFLYFVVSGLQNFVTQYLRNDPFNAPMKTIFVGFFLAVVIAPVLGVVTGGVILDRIGGYQDNFLRVTLFTCAWGVAAAFFSVSSIFITNIITFFLVISAMLFCGGVIIAPLSGILFVSLPEQLRPAGAAFAQMMYNLLGNFGGPMMCGLVAEWTGNLKYGIFTVFSCAVVGLVPMFVLLWRAQSVVGQRSLTSPVSCVLNVEPITGEGNEKWVTGGNNNNHNSNNSTAGNCGVVVEEKAVITTTTKKKKKQTNKQTATEMTPFIEINGGSVARGVCSSRILQKNENITQAGMDVYNTTVALIAGN